MRIPRASPRWLMAAVLAVALALGLGLPASEVHFAKDIHCHGFIGRRADSRWAIDEEEVRAPFWPRYRLRLRGQPWRGRPVCPKTPGRIDEVCSFEQSDSFSSCMGWMGFTPSVEMRRKVWALNGEPPDPRLEALVRSER